MQSNKSCFLVSPDLISYIVEGENEIGKFRSQELFSFMIIKGNSFLLWVHQEPMSSPQLQKCTVSRHNFFKDFWYIYLFHIVDLSVSLNVFQPSWRVSSKQTIRDACVDANWAWSVYKVHDKFVSHMRVLLCNAVFKVSNVEDIIFFHDRVKSFALQKAISQQAVPCK